MLNGDPTFYCPWHLGHNEGGQSSLQFVPADFRLVPAEGRCLSIKLNLRMRSAAVVRCESDYSTPWNDATLTILEMAGRVRDFMNDFFRLFAPQGRRKLPGNLRLAFPRSSIQTKNTSMQMILVI